MKKKSIILLIAASIFIPITLYFGGEILLDVYTDLGAKKLLKLEKQGKLSREYGYVWQEINANKEMELTEKKIAEGKISRANDENFTKKKTIDFPSLDAVRELNSIKTFQRTIRINDRNGVALAQLQTTHTTVKLSELNDILLKTLLATEDKNFHKRKKAYEYNTLLRASLMSVFKSLLTFHLQYPRGSSTIHMQVARFLLLKSDSRGYAFTDKSITRKIKELKLARALSELYTKDEILTLYVNHCVTAGKGMLGYHDISMGLFGVTPAKLSVPQSLYLARLVKWNRQVPKKIIHQIKTNMPLLARTFDWDKAEQRSISKSLDTLTFKKDSPMLPHNSYLIDLANEYWRQICKSNGMSETEIADLDISNPESMIRRYGSCTINLTIDYRLQKLLERIVSTRGFGSDTTIRTDVKIGGNGSDFSGKRIPSDTLRRLWIVKRDTLFVPSSTDAAFKLKKGDTVVCNIRFKQLSKDSIRRSCYYYKRDTLHVNGQYYAYAIMDSRTHKLLAYCSKDKLGSRLQSLLVNSYPNGSSVAKPLIYALSYDLDMYRPTDMSADDQQVGDTCLWARTLIYNRNVPVGMNYIHGAQKGGYQVHNDDYKFDGYDFLYNHLANSNNIMAVETMFRLTSFLKDNYRDKNVIQLENRLQITNPDNIKNITGPQLYCVIASNVKNSGLDINSCSSNYSVALGTLELSLLEQIHLFNILYDNTLVVQPAKHPSLFVNSIELAGSRIAFSDSISKNSIFNDIQNIRPVYLALHKRLISNPADRLDQYDICENGNDKYPANFAKSGTTDDVIKPFNADVTDTARTNYGLWNAVMRLRLKRSDLINAVSRDSSIKKMRNYHFNYKSVPDEEMLDVTLASIGECNKQFTGTRDGKTLHGYVSREFLHTFGVPCSSGVYAEYEKELHKKISDRDKYKNENKSDLSVFTQALIRLKSGFGAKADIDEIRFDKGPKLGGRSYRKMLEFASYMGENSRYYCKLIDSLRSPKSTREAEMIIEQISAIHPGNKLLEKDIDRACKSLLKSLKDLSIK